MTETPQPSVPQTLPQQATVTDRRMLETLVCPVTNAVLTYDADRQELISKAAHLAFPIRDGIPSCWSAKRVSWTDPAYGYRRFGAAGQAPAGRKAWAYPPP